MEPKPATNLFRKDGDYWAIIYEGRVLRLKDSKGLQYIAYLLRHPRQEFLARDLAIEFQDSTTQEAGVGDQRRESEDRSPMLDAKAKAAYKRRIADLRDELEEAERFHDVGRSAKAREEIERLADQLAAAAGLGGRNRIATPTPSARAGR